MAAAGEAKVFDAADRIFGGNGHDERALANGVSSQPGLTPRVEVAHQLRWQLLPK